MNAKLTSIKSFEQTVDHVLLHGGGLDSSSLFLHLVKNQVKFVVVHFDYGQVAYKAERAAIQRQCDKYEIRMFTIQNHTIRALNPGPNKLFDGISDKAYVESRNLALILHAHSKFEHAILHMGLDKPVTGVPFPDCSSDFLNAVKGDYGIEISAPFIATDKQEICESAYQFDPEFFANTMTCWTPVDGNECGECKHCKIKLQQLELKEPKHVHI